MHFQILCIKNYRIADKEVNNFWSSEEQPTILSTFCLIKYNNQICFQIIVVDLRSDTLTKPTQKMREALSSAEVGDDGFHEDPTVKGIVF